jgi:hypothetical protein
MVLANACPVPRVRSQIEHLLKENIDRRTARRLHDVEVHLEDNQVIISGEAHSYYVRQLALTSVLHALINWGPVQIVDNIRVLTLN